MKIKDKYTIKGHEWRVIFLDQVDEEDSMGECECTNRIIYIKDGLEEEEEVATFLHELLHAIMFESGIHCTSVSSDVQEIICENISLELARLFKVQSKSPRR